jgi:hypothetical protein
VPQRIDHAKFQLWKRRIAQFQKSHLTIAQFCKSIDCSTPTFHQWRRRIEQDSKSSFLQIETADSSVNDRAIEIKLPNGIAIFVPLQAIDSLPQILDRVA